MKRSEARSREAAEPDRDLAGALHEVSNALTVVLGWLEVAGDETPDSAAEQRAVEIAREYARLGHRIARRAIDAEPAVTEPERSAAELVRAAVLGITPEAKRQGVEVQLHDENGGARLVHDPAAARQILLNLLLNAIAFSPRGSVVRVTLGGGDDRVVFSVSDEGPGVDAERAETLLTGPDSTRRGGAGIGLRHSAALAEARGGSLSLTRPGPGGVFELSWPVVEVRSGAYQVGVPCHSLSGTRVLVVEDDAEVVTLIQLALGARGIQVVTADCADDIMRIARDGERLDAALVDLSPIARDLDSVMGQLRGSRGDLPVILISGLASGVPEGVEAKFAAWVRKPFEMGEVVDALESALERA